MRFSDDYDFIVLAAVRYAMGLRSYAVGLVINYVKRVWFTLVEPNTRQCIRRDVLHELELAERAGTTLGAEMDHRAWVRFLAWMDLKEMPE